VTDTPDDKPQDKVKKAMAGKKPVTGKPALTVIDGGQNKPKRARKPKAADERPEPPPHDDMPELLDPDHGVVDTDDEDAPETIGPADLEKARKCAPMDQNDRDNGRRLIIWFGDDMAYVPGMGWLTWRNSHWQRDEGELVVRLYSQELVDKIKLEALHILATPRVGNLLAAADAALAKADKDITAADRALIAKAIKARDQLAKKRAARRQFAVSSGNAGKTAAMLAQAASHKAIDQNLLDSDRMQFNTRNGTLLFSREPDPEQDLTPGEDGKPIVPRLMGKVTFAPHSRSDMITKRAEVDYDPDAACPRFNAFLEQMQPDDKMRLFLQVAHAYAMLIGGNDEQRLLYHYGTGANGKSVFLETLGNLAGSYRTVVSPDTITGDSQRGGQQASPDIARLFNTRFVVVEELPRGTPLKDNLIKAVSGGGTMTARFLQKELFEFQPIFTAVLSGNDMPEISGTDFGIWRRVLIVLWGVTVGEAERVPFGTMMKMFEEERAGILNWLVEGALAYLTHGLNAFIPASVNQFTQDYREERDPVGNFVAAHVRAAPGMKVSAGDMMKAYTAWCEANAVKPWNPTAFGRRLGALGLKKLRGSLVQYLDVALQDVPDRFDAGRTPPRDDPQDPGNMGR
jgi:putative DNA primase/helicase